MNLKPLSVKVSVKLSVSYEKFWWVKANSLSFASQKRYFPNV